MSDSQEKKSPSPIWPTIDGDWEYSDYGILIIAGFAQIYFRIFAAPDTILFRSDMGNSYIFFDFFLDF